jgi:hypothetical protein
VFPPFNGKFSTYNFTIFLPNLTEFVPANVYIPLIGVNLALGKVREDPKCIDEE